MVQQNIKNKLVSVCVCTTNRSTLRDTLLSILQQKLPIHVALEIVIVDNSADGGAKTVVQAIQKNTNKSIRYTSENTKNLSFLRNKSTSLACGQYLAFIDDDEVAEENWLLNHYKPIEMQEADITIGHVNVTYSSSCPQWLSDGNLLNKFSFSDRSKLKRGHTASAMLPRTIVNSYPFDPAYGNSGGEDTDVFFRAHRDGHTIIYCRDAAVTEYTDPRKENWEYLVRLNTAIGQNYYHIIYLKLTKAERVFAFLFTLTKYLLFALAQRVMRWHAAKKRYFQLRKIRNFSKLKWILGYGSHISVYCNE